jgi:tol-pal system protein YbgF
MLSAFLVSAGWMRTMLNCVAGAANSDMHVAGVGVKSLCVLALGASLILAAPTVARAQAGPADLLYRIERLENQIRQMTGDIEQLQYRNQQLEAALNEMRYQDPGRGGGRVATAPPTQPGAPGMSPGRRGDAFDPAENPNAPGSPRGLGAAPVQPAPAAGTSGPGGRRGGDAFDPSENPYAPGAPRTLGSTPPQPPPPNTRPGMGPTPYAAGAPGGADPGYGRAADDPRYGRPPAGPPPGGAAAAYPAVATAAPPPSGSPREVYDAGVMYLQRRDYAAAEESFRDFLRQYPTDRMAAEAQFSLGESLYQRQNYQEAADAFLQLTKKYENSPKAPDALLRLGQSLVALNDKELACVAFADVGRKYPRARSDVRQAIERELKRARCT